MQRSDFIKRITTAWSASILLPSFKWVKSYRKFYLLQAFVRGFKHYDGMEVLNRIESGTMLQLVREPDNEFDEFAIALHLDKIKIGFIPAESNEILSKLMDIKALEFLAEVIHVDLQAQPWEKISVAVYVLKEADKSELPQQMERITIMETPESLLIKNQEDFVTRFSYDDLDDVEYIYGK